MRRKKKNSGCALGCTLLVGFLIVVGLYSVFSSIGKTASVTPTDTPTTVVTINQVTPTVKPTIAPKPTQPACQAINNNPWCYSFTSGNLIYSPNADFCSYFACVSTFWTATSGYVAECANGDYTHSGSVRGACSHDGGVMRPLYSH